MLSGCWVSSVNGLVQESNFTVHTDSDVVVDQRLAGTWEATTDNCTTTLTITLKERTYHLASTEKGEKCVAPETDYRQAHLVKLDDHFFFDVFPAPDDVCDMCLPLHWIFLVKFDENLLSLTPIDSNWLKKSVEQKTVVLATMPGDTDKITASVKDLKAFCRKYGDDKEAFVATSDDVFRRKNQSRP